jgi:hypothetical protein
MLPHKVSQVLGHNGLVQQINGDIWSKRRATEKDNLEI